MKAFTTLMLILLFLSACGSDDELSPEHRVKRVLAQIEEGVEARSMSAVMDHVSDDYADHRGQVKQDIARIVQFHFIKNQQINIFTQVRSIEINGDLASVELSAAMAARGVDLSFEDNRLKADLHQFSVVLSETQDGWQISSASWQRGW